MKPKTIFKAALLISLFSFWGCSTQKFVKFDQKAQEPYSNNNLQLFLRSNQSPKIVLRVPNVEENVTTKNTNDAQIVVTQREKERERNDLYYNAIEKELLKAGFSVRDRGLFNEVLKKMQRDTKQNIDYSQIKELTNTDLILEVVKIDPQIRYVTNEYYTIGKKNTRKTYTSGTEYRKYGASAEFKIIMVSNNELAGSYKFHYTPCLEGCATSVFGIKKPTTKKVSLLKNQTTPEPYVGVEVDVMEEFIKRCTNDLVNSIKKY